MRNKKGQFVSVHTETLSRKYDETYLAQRQTAEKIVALFAKLHELQLAVADLSQQVQEFRKEQRAAARLLLAAVKGDLDREQQMATVRDFVYNKNNPK